MIALRSSVLPAAAALLALAPAVRAQDAAQEIVMLPHFVLVDQRVADPTPQGTFAMPVSALRFEPLADVQARNLAEGQADVAVRGGIFSNTGFRTGGVSLLDPQTGHYGAEIPVAPAMLSPAHVLTGVENSLRGLNASVATLAYDWSRIENRGEVSAALGEHGYRRFAAYEGAELPAKLLGGALAADLDYATSRSDGAIFGGDHDFSRVAGRLQWRASGVQTDLFAGYQDKFFGWPNLYTPFNWLETERIKTTLVSLNHRIEGAGDDYLQFAAHWRRNTDDYEADRTRPGVFNPYEHRTLATGASAEARRTLDAGWSLRATADVLADELRSTSLTFGAFNSRTYLKAAVAATKTTKLADGAALDATAGASWADTNRDGGRVSPVGELAWSKTRDGRRLRAYAQLAGNSQVPDYTALNSNSAAGLFRGNPSLGRSRSTNWETGVSLGGPRLDVQGAVFFRQDRGLTDWTLRRGVTARLASPVDIDTSGAELVATWRWKTGRVVLGYTWLQKAEDYRGAVVDASFYALNFPKHRVTAAVVWRPLRQLELRLDNEYRDQEPNFLRRSSPRAILSSAGAHWLVPNVPGLEVAVLVDNMFNSAFEELPAVPAAPRQYSASLGYHW